MGQSRKLVFGHRQFADLLQNLASFPSMGEKLIEMWERDVGRNREKMPEKKRPIQKMCWRKLEETLFPFSPYSGYKLYFTSFGVKSPWGGGPSHHYYVSTVFKVPKNQLT